MAEVAISGTEGSGNVSFQFKSFHSSSGLQLSDITIAIYELPPPYYRLCTGTDVGDIYDPTDARTSASYESACMNNRTSCAVGDLRNRLGKFNMKLHDGNRYLVQLMFARSAVVLIIVLTTQTSTIN